MKLGVGFDIHHIDQSLLKDITILNIENPLYPGFLEQVNTTEDENISEYNFEGSIIVDGPYIDLNPATPEPAIRKIVKKKVLDAIYYAKLLQAEEIIFLSTFLPMIKVDFYDRGWVDGSVDFWTEITHSEKDIRISLCNIFEENPDYLIEIAEKVGVDNFGLAFDLGHALAYSEIAIDKWYKKVDKYIHTVYVHSNHGDGDLHLNINEGILLKDEGFNKIKNEMTNKNLIIKLFDKTKLIDNITILKDIMKQQ